VTKLRKRRWRGVKQLEVLREEKGRRIDVAKVAVLYNVRNGGMQKRE
jgi:hypothetical protein